VAVRLGVGPDTVRKLAAAGTIPAIRFGSRAFWRFDPLEVEEAIRRAKR
jgi:excisionase family DNA binding protein